MDIDENCRGDEAQSRGRVRGSRRSRVSAAEFFVIRTRPRNRFHGGRFSRSRSLSLSLSFFLLLHEANRIWIARGPFQ